MSKVVDLKKRHDRLHRHVDVMVTMLFGRRSNAITRCHSSRSHFYCLLIIFTDVPFLHLKFYTVVGTILTYDYTMFGILGKSRVLPSCLTSVYTALFSVIKTHICDSETKNKAFLFKKIDGPIIRYDTDLLEFP